MKFTSSVLFVKDIMISKQFYTELMNLKIEQDFNTNISFTCGIAIWEIDKDHPIINKLNISEKSNRTELYFESDDIDSHEQKLTKANVRFLHKMHVENWGQKTIRFFDPDNHLIELGESMICLVNRLHKEGMSALGIYKKTGISLSSVDNLLK